MTAICYDQHQAWKRAGLMEFSDFADCVEYVNQSEYGDGQLQGAWFYVDYDNFVLYYGTFGNDNAPGASSYTHAYLFDEESPSDGKAFHDEVEKFESYPEYLNDFAEEIVPDGGEVCEDCKSTDNHVERIQDDNDQWWECIVCDRCKRTLKQATTTWTP